MKALTGTPYDAAADHYAGNVAQNGTSFWFLPWGTAHHEGRGLRHVPLLFGAVGVMHLLSWGCLRQAPAAHQKPVTLY